MLDCSTAEWSRARVDRHLNCMYVLVFGQVPFPKTLQSNNLVSQNNNLVSQEKNNIARELGLLIKPRNVMKQKHGRSKSIFCFECKKKN